jgi:predicted Zn finger-like uncharacterized protein
MAFLHSTLHLALTTHPEPEAHPIMANIRVTCPTCKTNLEIDAEYEGQEVECGNCLQVFVAKTASSSSSGSSSSGSRSGSGRSSSRSQDTDEEERPARRSRRRDDDDDDDYDHDRRRDDDDDDDDYSPRRSRGNDSNGLAIASLILGIIAVFPGCCCGLISIPCGLGAVITGAIGMKSESGKPMAIIGIVLGVVALAWITFAIILNVGMGGMNNNNRFR